MFFPAALGPFVVVLVAWGYGASARKLKVNASSTRCQRRTIARSDRTKRRASSFGLSPSMPSASTIRNGTPAARLLDQLPRQLGCGGEGGGAFALGQPGSGAVRRHAHGNVPGPVGPVAGDRDDAGGGVAQLVDVLVGSQDDLVPALAVTGLVDDQGIIGM